MVLQKQKYVPQKLGGGGEVGGGGIKKIQILNDTKLLTVFFLA